MYSKKIKPPNYEFGSKVGSELSFLKKKEGKCFIIKHSPSSVSGPTCPRRRVLYVLIINELSDRGGSVSEPFWLVFRTF